MRHGLTCVVCLQKYTIRDLNTGQLFVVDAEPAAPSEVLSEPGSPKTASELVTDVSSGREMSMEEFDRALGLHTALEVDHALLVMSSGPILPRQWKYSMLYGAQSGLTRYYPILL